MPEYQDDIFAPLPKGSYSWRALAASSVMHGSLLLLLILIPLFGPTSRHTAPVVFVGQQALAPFPELDRVMMTPDIPVLKVHKAQQKTDVPVPRQPPPRLRELQPPEPKTQPEPAALARVEPPPEPSPQVPSNPSPGPPRAMVTRESPKPAIRTNIFPGEPAPATTHRAAREVQTGGFGSPSGVAGPASDKGDVPTLGSFDRPAGPGQGNGTGGSKGVPGTVASAGFGSGIVARDGTGDGNGSGKGQVRSGSFGDLRPEPSTGGGRNHIAPSSPNITPVEVVYKPKPSYSREAREMKLEGEVLVEVLFKATGEIQVFRLVQGLGHGLDEEAVRAAQMIRFKPAQHDGKPVDSRAIVHIIFRLA